MVFLIDHTPLKNNWERLMRPVVDQLKLLIRFNPQSKCVELKVFAQKIVHPRLLRIQSIVELCKRVRITFTRSCWDLRSTMLLRCYVSMTYISVCSGFVLWFVETFEIKDVRLLHGDHISRAIGRIAGQVCHSYWSIVNKNKSRCRWVKPSSPSKMLLVAVLSSPIKRIIIAVLFM